MPRIADPDALRDIRLADWVGWYLVRHSRSSPQVPAMIGLCDHEPGMPENRMDRTYFVAVLGNEDVDPYEVVACKEHITITEAEFRFRLAERAWAKEWAPHDAAAAHPKRKVDYTKIPPVEP